MRIIARWSRPKPTVIARKRERCQRIEGPLPGHPFPSLQWVEGQRVTNASRGPNENGSAG